MPPIAIRLRSAFSLATAAGIASLRRSCPSVRRRGRGSSCGRRIDEQEVRRARSELGQRVEPVPGQIAVRSGATPVQEYEQRSPGSPALGGDDDLLQRGANQRALDREVRQLGAVRSGSKTR